MFFLPGIDFAVTQTPFTNSPCPSSKSLKYSFRTHVSMEGKFTNQCRHYDLGFFFLAVLVLAYDLFLEAETTLSLLFLLRALPPT